MHHPDLPEEDWAVNQWPEEQEQVCQSRNEDGTCSTEKELRFTVPL